MRETTAGMTATVTKLIIAYKPHFHSLFVWKMRRRNKQTDSRVHIPEIIPIGAAIELHFKAVIAS